MGEKTVMQLSRRRFLRTTVKSAGGAAAALSALPAWMPGAVQGARAKPVNVLLLTADDMNYDAVGAFGSKVEGATPNLDRLASEGLRFEHGHVTIAVCQPCRQVLMTGRYPHRNGAPGFEPINLRVPTLQESLERAGYLNGIMGKVSHLAPRAKFPWSTVVEPAELGNGRNADRYYTHAKAFFERAARENKPFFLMANSHDPHRPFHGSGGHERMARNSLEKNGVQVPPPSRVFRDEEVVVPGFLPDIPNVRKEVAQYYCSARRCDDALGAVLRALKETGLEERTLVMFLSDHGMAFPFAKTNCYLNSTKTPWMVRWPGGVEPGTVDAEHFVSGIDYMPTILDAVGLPHPPGMDGNSFLPLLRGEKQAGREWVFTEFHKTSAKRPYPMRCVQDARFGYIYNPWSDGEEVFRNESQAGLTFKAMREAATHDQALAGRVRLFQYRVPEEFYDLEHDPDALHNLIDNPHYQARIGLFRRKLLQRMARTSDPVLGAFKELCG